MGKVRKYSSTRLIADALGVNEKLIPESLRNRVNTYKANETIPQSMFDVSEGIHYDSVEFKRGNLTYIRNLAILDTLFDNTQHVKKLMLNSLESSKKEKLIDDLFDDITVRRDVLNAIGGRLQSVKSALMKEDLDMAGEELPNPFSDGISVANLLLSQIDNQKKEELSLHDQILKEILSKQYDKAAVLLSQVSEVSLGQDFHALKEIVASEIEAAQSYYSFLKKL